MFELLGSKNATVCCDAIDALGKTGDARAIKPLVEMLGDENAGFRAAYALSKIRLPAVEPSLNYWKMKIFLSAAEWCRCPG